MFTDGSSSGSGALRRAGWASGGGRRCLEPQGGGARGAVPSDVLPGQFISPRDGEDYAAAMAEQFTLDPLTLYIDCEGTIATINGQKHKAFGARGPPRTRLEQAPFFPQRGQGCQGQGSCDRARRGGEENFPRVQKGKRLCRHLCQERGRHSQACFSRGQDSHCLCFPGQTSGTLGGRGARFAQVQGSGTTPGLLCNDARARPLRARLKRKRRKRDCSTNVGPGVRLAFPHRSLTFLARQSPRPSHFQRAELAIGRSFRCWGLSFGQRHHFFAPSVERSAGSVRMLFAAAAAKSQGAERRSCAN